MEMSGRQLRRTSQVVSKYTPRVIGPVRGRRFKRGRRASLLSNPRMVYQFKRSMQFSPVLMNSNYGFKVGGVRNKAMSMWFGLSGSTISTTGTESIDLPNYTEFTALFDSYRIDKVVVHLILSNNSSTVASVSTQMPTVQICQDQDDANLPASSNELLQRPETVIHNFGSSGPNGNSFKKTIVPKPALAAYRAGAFTGYATPSGPQWINSAYPTVQHYGLKMYFDSPSTVDVDFALMQIYVDYYLSFKGVQ